MTLGNVGSKLITFFLVPLYTSALTTEEYGTTDLIFTLYSLLIPIVTLQCSFALMRFALEKDADHSQLFSIASYITLVSVVILMLLRPAFAAFDAIAPYFWYFIAYCLTTSVSELLLYFARGLDRVRDYAIATLINTATVVALNVVFLICLRLGIVGYLLAYTIAPAVTSVFLAYRLRASGYLLPPWRIAPGLVREMAVYCIPLIPNSVSW